MTTTVTARRPTRGKPLRDRQRAAHLITGALLIVYVYLPASASLAVQPVIRWLVLPLLVIDGILMWQWPRIRRMVRQWRKRR
jgi:hypothetical protein